MATGVTGSRFLEVGIEVDMMDGEQTVDDKTENIHKGTAWTNEDKAELVKLRIQGLTFREIGARIGRTKHAARSEYGRIRRGETDVTVSLKELPELRSLLPIRRS
jgi:hypothetical protein